MFDAQKRRLVWLLMAFMGGIALTTAVFAVARCSNANYPLINPMTPCIARDAREAVTFTVFQKTLERWMDEYAAEYGVTESAVYFRDLQNGPTFGINDHILFSPSSLLKVPVMIAVFREAEREPTILEQEIEIKGAMLNPSQDIEPEKTVIDGHTYTVAELVEKMIVNSDNRSKDILRRLLILRTSQEDPLFETLQDAGMATEDYREDDFLSVKTYAAFFRMLYHATFLNREMSNAALELLTRTTFTQGLVAGLPLKTTAAHKFGIRDNNITKDLYQLHDCGIIYHPRRAYMLCIMTRGTDLDQMARFIAKISSMVYAEVDIKY
ncbi:MAG TPA: serine hydrolase [Candidatus Peribacterales bacterium]|nr:serine hydrolase [Candidatus Peribacterales bacterium]